MNQRKALFTTEYLLYKLHSWADCWQVIPFNAAAAVAAQMTNVNVFIGTVLLQYFCIKGCDVKQEYERVTKSSKL